MRLATSQVAQIRVTANAAALPSNTLRFEANGFEVNVVLSSQPETRVGVEVNVPVPDYHIVLLQFVKHPQRQHIR